jgi:secreted trypsin-like serine protease
VAERGDLRGSRALALLACALASLLLPAAASAAPGATASIVGGHSVTIEEFPSLAYIEAVEGKGGFSCTGTVVAPRVVLTAAHCVESIEKGTITPAAGYALSTGVADPRKADSSDIFHVVANHVFPGFDPGVLHGDAAILVLDRPTTAPTIPLAGSADAALYAGGAEAQLTGWGLTRASSKEPPPHLRATTTLVQPSNSCRQKVKPFYKPYLPAAQVCVLAADRKSGGCFGDSGGPAIAKRADGSAVQIGVTSTGGPECSPKVPTVLTRADFISTWVSEWIAATESGAPTPKVDPAAPLPQMTRESAEEFAVYTLIKAMGKRFERSHDVLGGCKKVGSRFRCEIEWFLGRNVYVADVSPFYLRRQEAVAWDSHYRIEWAVLKCIQDQRNNRRCPVHGKRG